MKKTRGEGEGSAPPDVANARAKGPRGVEWAAMKTFRLLIAGMIHDHVWKMLPQFAKIPGLRIVGGADPNRPLREKLRKECGVTALFEKPSELFDRVEADGVLVCDS